MPLGRFVVMMKGATETQAALVCPGMGQVTRGGHDSCTFPIFLRL